MKLTKIQACPLLRGRILGPGVVALAPLVLGAGPARAQARDLVVWPPEVEEGYARPLHLQATLRADREGLLWSQVGGPCVPLRELGEGRAEADVSGLDVATDVELVFAVTNGVDRATAESASARST